MLSVVRDYLTAQQFNPRFWIGLTVAFVVVGAAIGAGVRTLRVARRQARLAEIARRQAALHLVRDERAA